MVFFIILIIIVVVLAIAISNTKSPERLPQKILYQEPSRQLSVNLNFTESVLDVKHANVIVLDIETTGLPRYPDAKPEDLSAWPFVVQLSWIVFDADGKMIKLKTHIIKPRIPIPVESSNIHRITTEIANIKGVDPVKAFNEFLIDIQYATCLVAHNISFDIPIIEAELIRNGFGKQLEGKDKACTMMSSIQYCSIPKYRGRGYKYPKLTELFGVLFANDYSVRIPEAHDAEVDALMTAKCYFELKKRIDLKITKGKSNFIVDIRPMIYDPDNDFIAKPEFKKITPRFCPDKKLVDEHDNLKKKIMNDWNRLYGVSETKIGSYGLDRLGYKARLCNFIDEIDYLVTEINSYNPKD